MEEIERSYNQGHEVMTYFYIGSGFSINAIDSEHIKGDKIILKFSIPSGLKQFTSQFLCAKLMFKKIPQKIEYVITSKSFGHEIKGYIEAPNND